MGYTTRKHLLLDFDNTSIDKLEKVIYMIFKEFPEVGDCLILSTNDNEQRLDIKYDNYQRPYHKIKSQGFHAVFDNVIGYNKCCKIIETLAGLRIINKDYSDIRRFRGDMTLRITPKVLKYSYKDYPKGLTYFESPYKKRMDNYIFNYLYCLHCACSLGLPHFETERITNNRTQDSNDRAKTSPINTLINRV